MQKHSATATPTGATTEVSAASASVEGLPTFEWVYATPEIAAEWLANMVPNRRRIRRKIDQYAHLLEIDKWRHTAEPVQFNTAGRMMNGQNRSLAIIKSGKSVWLPVARGVEGDAMGSIDSGQSRTKSDVFEIAGEFNAKVKSAAMGMLMRIEAKHERPYMAGGDASVGYVGDELLEAYYDRYTDLNVAIVDAATMTRGAGIPASNAMWATVVMWARRENEERADEFVEDVRTGSNLPIGSPVLALCNQMRRERGRLTKPSQEVYAAYAIKAWQAYLENRKASRFMWKVGGGELFPRMAGWPKVEKAA